MITLVVMKQSVLGFLGVRLGLLILIIACEGQ